MNQTHVSLSGQVAMVTGGGGGIGRETARVLCAAGMTVVVLDLRAEALAETVASVSANGGKIHSMVVNITDHELVEKAVAEVVARFSRIDVLVNNAGLFRAIGPTWEVPVEAWRRDVEVNLFGTFNLCRAVIPVMRRQGSGVIMNLDGGGGANYCNPGGAAYAASKAAIVRFTESLAGELEREAPGVIVFAIHPGFTRTTLTETAMQSPWQAIVRDKFAAGDDRRPDWCGQTLVELLGIIGPDLNGRTFDEYLVVKQLAADRRKMVSHQLFLMRTPGFRDIRWRRRIRRFVQRMMEAVRGR